MNASKNLINPIIDHLVKKSLLRESNPRPFAYEANALPTKLNRLTKFFW
jgi:hypothetical protein